MDDGTVMESRRSAGRPKANCGQVNAVANTNASNINVLLEADAIPVAGEGLTRLILVSCDVDVCSKCPPASEQIGKIWDLPAGSPMTVSSSPLFPIQNW